MSLLKIGAMFRHAFNPILFVLSASLLTSGCFVSGGVKRSPVLSVFQIQPSSGELTQGASLKVSGLNGKAPYTFEKVSGAGTVASDGTVISVTGGETITVKATDANGKTAYGSYLIFNPPEILPASIQLAVNNKYQFSASGGKPPYAFSVVSGGGSITTSGSFTAPNNVGTVVIEVADALGGRSQRSIDVVDKLEISPAAVTIATNNSETFAITGGVGPFTWLLESGSGALDSLK